MLCQSQIDIDPKQRTFISLYLPFDLLFVDTHILNCICAAVFYTRQFIQVVRATYHTKHQLDQFTLGTALFMHSFYVAIIRQQKTRN